MYVFTDLVNFYLLVFWEVKKKRVFNIKSSFIFYESSDSFFGLKPFLVFVKFVFYVSFYGKLDVTAQKSLILYSF